jgi:pimeloyl-ACP methyl ester carboxylesterase
MTPELQTDARLVVGSANGVPDGMRSLLARRGTDVLHSVRRRFVRVQGRDVHYLRVGVGPPVVLLHAAMSSARGLLPLLQRLATDHTVFAFDHPGMGDSAPLAKRDMQAADAADALKATLLALRMPRCPIYGSHTGAAVALELACRHPERVSALTMDGVTVFTPREKVFFLSEGYMPPFTVKNDGSHLQSAWVKARDHFVWFPWNTRLAKNRMPWPFASWRAVHDMFLEILRAGDAYRALYGAAFKLDGRRAVAALTVPTTIMSSANDPLLPHLKRLGRLKPNQRIRRYPSDPVAYLDATANLMRGHRVQAQAPVDALFRPSPGAINRRYIDLTGGQILMRSTAEALSGRPLLLLHEGRASCGHLAGNGLSSRQICQTTGPPIRWPALAHAFATTPTRCKPRWPRFGSISATSTRSAQAPP